MKSARRIWLGIALPLLILIASQAEAGFLFYGSQPILFIPPTNPRQGQPTFTANAPSILCPGWVPGAFPPPCGSGVRPWRIRNPGVPFFPVPRGVPLIQDNTLVNTPFLTPAFTWGIWDPPATVDIAAVIDV